MADAPLHPEVEKAIAEGPQHAYAVGGGAVGGPVDLYESPQVFARRIALLAAVKAREGLRDSIVDVLIETDAAWSVSEARAVAEEAIRRGTP